MKSGTSGAGATDGYWGLVFIEEVCLQWWMCEWSVCLSVQHCVCMQLWLCEWPVYLSVCLSNFGGRVNGPSVCLSGYVNTKENKTLASAGFLKHSGHCLPATTGEVIMVPERERERERESEHKRLEQNGIWNVLAKNVSMVTVFFAETFQISFRSPTSVTVVEGDGISLACHCRCSDPRPSSPRQQMLDCDMLLMSNILDLSYFQGS